MTEPLMMCTLSPRCKGGDEVKETSKYSNQSPPNKPFVGHGKLRWIGTSLVLWTNKLSIQCKTKIGDANNNTYAAC